MERLFLEWTIRAAVLVAVTAFVLYAMRVKQPVAKHRVWTGVLVLMLLLPAWTAWGPKLRLRLLPSQSYLTATAKTSPFAIVSITSTASPSVPTQQAALLGLYLLGLCVFLIRLATGTLRARRLAREAVVDGVRTSRFCAAPLTVGFFHPVVILPKHWREWPRPQLDAILAHEREHACRHDPLVQWLALLNRAVFWFHPAAWWLERNLSALAEQACDDAVLARGHNPRTYAECLIDIARTMASTGRRVNLAGMAMPGTFLPQRIRKIVESGQSPPISRSRIACVSVLCVITCSITVAGMLGRAQQPAANRSATTEGHRFLHILTPHAGVDFSVFSADLIERVKMKWYHEMPAKVGQAGAKGKVTVRIRIQKDGSLGGMPTVEVSSGHKSLDDASVAAVRASAPFEHLPDSFKGPNIELLLTFFYNMAPTDATPTTQPSGEFILGDLKIQGDIRDPNAMRERILNQFQGRGYSSAKTLADMVSKVGVLTDLQNRGYFKAAANVVQSQALGITDGKQRVLVTVSVNEGEQYHVASVNVYASDPSMTVPPPEVAHGLVRLKQGDLFDISELRSGLARLKQWYATHDGAEAKTIYEIPQFQIDDAHHTIAVTIGVSTDKALRPSHN